MNQFCVGIARVALSLTLVGLTLPAVAEHRTVDVGELARCAAISGAGERLACYDSLAAVAVPGARNAPAAMPPEAASSRTAATGGDVQSAQAPAVAGAAAGAATAAGAQSGGTGAAAPGSADSDDPVNFGLTPHQLKTTPKGPERIKAVVSQLTEDRLNNVFLVLDNGQTWSLVESDPRVRPGDAVTIKRAALGSYLMLTPSRRSYRVQRIN